MGMMKRLNVKRMLKEAKKEEYTPRPAFMYKPRRAKTEGQGNTPQKKGKSCDSLPLFV